jgi:hypothetical protein
METDDEKPTSESSSTDSSEPQSAARPRIKLRDLRPEKDPMGADRPTPAAAPQREI